MKKRYRLAILVLFFVLTTLTVYAEESTVLLESRVSDQSVVLYMRNTGSTATQAQIASENVTDITVDGQDKTLPITTWLLVDNSISIDQADRERMKELLADLVSSRSSNEAVTLCTFADHLNPIITESQDYSELKQAIDDIEHYDQETYLTDCLDELLALETARTDARYVRVVVISDGVDNNPEGITRDELEKKLEKNDFPIYSIGCAGKAQELKEMYAISRQTNAKYWALSEVQNNDITRVMSSEEIPVRITIPIPASLCDGTTKGVQVTFDDGTTLQTQVDMPFGAPVSPPVPKPIIKPEPEPEPVPPPPPPLPDPTIADWMRAHWLLIVVLAFVIVVLAVGGYFFLQRREPQKPKNEADTEAPVQGEKAAPPRGSIILGREEGNDIRIDDPRISKRHCAITVSGDNHITVYDLNSLNGTRVDGVELERGGHRQARSGSALTLANVEFEMEICTGNHDALPDPGATIFMYSEDIEPVVSGGRILRITDMSRGGRCYSVPLPDAPTENTQHDETVLL